MGSKKKEISRRRTKSKIKNKCRIRHMNQRRVEKVRMSKIMATMLMRTWTSTKY